MKRIIIASMGSLLIACAVATAEPVAADQKWLETVQKMVEKGQNNISTPNQERVKLLKEWAAKKGITVAVTKTETSFKLELTKGVAKN